MGGPFGFGRQETQAQEHVLGARQGTIKTTKGGRDDHYSLAAD